MMIFQQMRKTISIYVALLALILAGCSKYRHTSDYENIIIKTEDIPQIVFMCSTDYSAIANENEVVYDILFYDHKGNIYFSDDPEVCSMEYKNMVKEFAEGDFENKITLIGTCEVNELMNNYSKLCELSKVDGYQLVYPEEVLTDPDVKKYWYGIYYNESKELEVLKLHDRNIDGDHDANDERATEIYEWFEENISKDVK